MLDSSLGSCQALSGHPGRLLLSMSARHKLPCAYGIKQVTVPSM
jgi:hypothetical protein